MTVTHTIDARFGRGVYNLLLRWKGSIFKLVWRDLFVFLVVYFSLSLLYRFGLNAQQQTLFELIAVYCNKYGTLIPVSFVLGFYVSLVIGRWWAQYKIIPWVDNVASWVNTSIPGEDDENRMLRRTICRYICLAITQCFTLISSGVKKRFPTGDHLIAAGLLLENEKADLDYLILGGNISKYQTHWIPFVWANSLVAAARAEGRIVSDAWMRALVDEINNIKNLCNLLLGFDRIRVPLVYTQVVTFAVYTYFFSCLLGRQWVHTKPDKKPAMMKDQEEKSAGNSGKFGVEELDLVVPVFTILQFFFYIGWLKVAESLSNPFGEDDYNFELNWMVDRNLQVSYLIVDKMHLKTPNWRKKDIHWEDIIPSELPHTLASVKYDNDPPESSTANVVVSNKEGEIVAPTPTPVIFPDGDTMSIQQRRKSLETNNSVFMVQ